MRTLTKKILLKRLVLHLRPWLMREDLTDVKYDRVIKWVLESKNSRDGMLRLWCIKTLPMMYTTNGINHLMKNAEYLYDLLSGRSTQ